MYLRLYKQWNVQNTHPLSTQPTLENTQDHSPADGGMHYRIEFLPQLLVTEYNFSKFPAIEVAILLQDFGSKR